MTLKRLCLPVLLVALVTSLSFAAEKTVPCERPLKHLNCAELKALEKSKGCVPEVISSEPCAKTTCCPQDVATNYVYTNTNTIEKVPVPGPERIVPGPEVDVQRGQFLLGGGPVFLNKVGVTALFGYQFRKTGIILLGGPLFIPQQAGTASYQVTIPGGGEDGDNFHAPPGWIKNGKAGGDGEGDCNRNTTFTVPGTDQQNGLGAQILAVFPLHRRHKK
jgi:hypothetical protein